MAIVKITKSGNGMLFIDDDGNSFCTSLEFIKGMIKGMSPRGFVLLTRMPNKVANLNCILMLREKFNCKVGYSCHSSEMIVPIYAVGLGATSIEKHITIDRTMYGSDQSASMEIEGFRKMIKYIREAEVVFGDGIKRISKVEEEVMKKLRRVTDY